MTKKKVAPSKKIGRKKASGPKESALVPHRQGDSLQSRDPLSLYMSEAARYPLLTPEKEKTLALRVFEEKDIRAAQILAQSNLRFVIKIAMEYARYAQRALDLIQEGNLGLIHAIREFNPHKEVRLTTYAVWWIRSYIQDYLLRNWSLVRMGTTKAQKKLFYRLKQEQEALRKQGIEPYTKAIAMNLGVPEKDVKTMEMRLSGKDLSLNAPMAGTSDEGSQAQQYVSRLADTSALPSDILEASEQSQLFHQALEEFQTLLNDREKHIFSRRLMAEKPSTLSDIGESFNVSKERARQLEERIKEKLKVFLSEKYPDISIN